MKTIARFFFAALAISAASSCTKDTPAEKNLPVKDGMIAYEASISMEETRAILDGNTVVWEVGEKIAVYDGVNADPNEFEVTAASGSSATIKGEISKEATGLMCVFPFDAASGQKEDSLFVNIPSSQVIAEGRTIASGALVSIAKAAVGESIAFRNAVSILKFTLPVDGIRKVVFSGQDDLGVAGTVGFKPGESPVPTYKGKSSMSVSKADGFARNTAYYASVVARDVAGVKFVLTADDCKSAVTSANTAAFPLNGGKIFTFDEAKINAGKFPLSIYTKDDLDAFAANSSSYEAGEWVTLCADIDYDGQWTSVADFVGNFDGGNHSIFGSTAGLTFKANDKYPEYIGFFSKIYAEVKNLKLGYNPDTASADSHSDLKYTDATIKYAGPLAGAAASRSNVGPVRISNITNYAEHHTSQPNTVTVLKAGNIVGIVSADNAEFTNCMNYGVWGNITTAAGLYEDCLYYGGIAGIVQADHVCFSGCANYGDIKARTKTSVSGTPFKGACFLGGIVGRTAGSTKDLKFVSCITGSTIYDSSTNLKAQVFIGGILGADNATADDGYDVIMEKCVNECKKLKLGSQTSRCSAGGMIGYSKANIHLSSCVNGKETDETCGTMPLSGNTGTNTMAGYGGMVGIADGAGVIEGCINYAPINVAIGKSMSTACPSGFGRGGIIGLATGTSTLSIEGCKNYGTIEMAYSKALTFDTGAGIGGIVGENLSAARISACENFGTITENATGTQTNAGAGGLIGYQAAVDGYQSAQGCKVNCTVTSSNAGGMIVGNNVGASVWGSASSKVKVKGTFNSTVLDASNYTTMLAGGAGAATCNAEYGE